MTTSPTLVTRFYQNLSPALRPEAESAQDGPGAFSAPGPNRLKEIATSFIDTLRAGEETAKAGLAGRADAQSVVTALASSEIAVQTAVTLRDRVVAAYQEILRMPV